MNKVKVKRRFVEIELNFIKKKKKKKLIERFLIDLKKFKVAKKKKI
jgi:hypothetical protein